MQQGSSMTPRLVLAGAIALVVLAIMAFCWLANSDVAGTPGVTGSAPAAQTQPVQSSSDDSATPSTGKKDCPGHGGAGQGAGASAPEAAPSGSGTSSDTDV